jgi:hypothetical protein
LTSSPCMAVRKTHSSSTPGPDAMRGLLAEMEALSLTRVHRRQRESEHKALEPGGGERNEAGSTETTLSAHPLSHPPAYQTELSPYAPRRTRTPSLLIRSHLNGDSKRHGATRAVISRRRHPTLYRNRRAASRCARGTPTFTPAVDCGAAAWTRVSSARSPQLCCNPASSSCRTIQARGATRWTASGCLQDATI